MDAKNFIADLIRCSISANAVYNGEFIEIDVNIDEIAEYIVNNGVVVPEDLIK